RSLFGILGKCVEKLIVVAFVVLTILFSMQVYFSYRSTNRLLEAIIWVEKTHEIIALIKDFEVDLRATESALRSYVIIGNLPRRKEYMDKSSQEVRSRLAKITTMAFPYQTLRDPLAKIEALLGPRLELMHESQSHYEKGLGGSEEMLLRSDAAMHRLVHAIEDFIAEAQQLSSARIAEREKESNTLKAITMKMALFGGFFVVLALAMVLLGLNSRRKTEALLRSSLEEKEVLLKEIHHRVKNNLQIISSLLILQGNKIKDREAGRIFLECRERIEFMASLHRQLYASGHFTSIDFGKNLAEIAATLVRSHAPADCKVALETSIPPLELDIETSQVLSLIVSEVLLNSLKHAFQGRVTGRIRVALLSGEMNELAISDDGVGLAGGVGIVNESHAGIGLVEALARQIRGKAELSPNPGGGLCFTIKFPSPNLQKEALPRNS
ncbi:MAG: hypothetical protein RL630_1451, partial [Verrucomicrobiota bacterium]